MGPRVHREKAAYPLAWLKEKKFWPTVARIDDSKFEPSAGRHDPCTDAYFLVS